MVKYLYRQLQGGVYPGSKLSGEYNGCAVRGLNEWMHEKKNDCVSGESLAQSLKIIQTVLRHFSLERWWKMLSPSGGLVWPLSAISYFSFCPSGRRQRLVRTRATVFFITSPVLSQYECWTWPGLHKFDLCGFRLLVTNMTIMNELFYWWG